MFVYRAVMEMAQFGDTEIEASKLKATWLSFVSDENGGKKLEEEFARLSSIVDDRKALSVGKLKFLRFWMEIENNLLNRLCFIKLINGWVEFCERLIRLKQRNWCLKLFQFVFIIYKQSQNVSNLILFLFPGANEENKFKNQCETVIPFDRNRVILTPDGMKPHSTYINASFIEGYNNDESFIITQVRNQTDYWRFITRYPFITLQKIILSRVWYLIITLVQNK